MNQNDKILVAGGRGMVGRAICRALSLAGYDNVLPISTSDGIDLSNSGQAFRLFEMARPQYLFVAAARVGGILANQTRPADFLSENLSLQINLLYGARKFGVKKTLFLGSSCIYPRDAAQPIREEALLSGPLEETNRAYAIAKIAGLEMCRALRQQYGLSCIALMPTNLYGPHDNFDLETSHVVPALMRKICEARESCAAAETVEVWGTGTPRREFLHVDDLAAACLFAMQHYDDEMPLNVGSGEDLPIRELAELIARIAGYEGRFVYDESKPDGTPRKLLDSSRIRALGWKPQIELAEGLRQTYQWFLWAGRRP